MSTDNESPRILRVAETASTNSLLRELVIKESLAEGSVVVADFQTAGRGQIGNTWESEAGKNLMFSLVLYPTCIPANRQFLISQIAALSVKEALDLYADHITVKWPNDISGRGFAPFPLNILSLLFISSPRGTRGYSSSLSIRFV